MGTWHGTCALSRLPINRGDKVILLLLLKNKNERDLGSGYASSGPYTPVCVPAYGEYNDLGGIENIQLGNKLEHAIMDHINNLLKTKTIKHKEETEKYQPYDLRSFIFDVSRGNIENISLMLVIEDLYYDVMAEFSLRKDYNNESIQERAIKSAKEYTEAKKPGGLFQHDEHLFSKFFYYNKMTSLINTAAENEGSELINALIELYIFNELLDISRILWTPQAGAGSDYAEYEVHKRIGQYVIYKALDQKVKNREENEVCAETYEGMMRETPAWM